MNKITILQGHVLKMLKILPDNTFDSCVTDPPYELGFMGKKWDSSGITYSVEVWREVLRVLKPGAHLLAFGGSRTYHRMVCAVEDAGFEIRDQIQWIYGSGFPKSLDVSKAIDKAAGADRETIGENPNDRKQRSNPLSDYGLQGGVGKGLITTPATNLARQWEGWGTALKPAHEPIVVARKPLEGTVVENVIKHGCGGINVGGCSIEFINETDKKESMDKNQHADFNSNDGIRVPTKGIYHGDFRPPENYNPKKGRWPANVIHDGSEEVLAEFEKYGERPSGEIKAGQRSGTSFSIQGELGIRPVQPKDIPPSNGSAARFFYCAKASQAERNMGLEAVPYQKRDESRKDGNPGGDNPRNRGVNPVKNFHPTVKPLALMRYLVRLVTPPGGLGLDCFCGSGSTLIAYAQEGFDAVGIDISPEYCTMSERRIKADLGMMVEIRKNP